METAQGKFPPPPGLIGALVRGFDSVAGRVLVILPPVLLDLFLWLGPHLRIKSFLQPMIDQLPSSLQNVPASLSNLPQAQQSWTAFLDRINAFAGNFNLFSLLRTFPVGVSGLLSYRLGGQSSLGLPLLLDAGSLFGLLGWAALLLLIGWLMGGLYYYWVAGVALRLETRSFSQAMRHSALLSGIWVGVLFLLGFPALIMASILFLISPLLGEVVMIAASVMVMWILVPVFFSSHGIFTFQLDAPRSILSSLRMVRYTLPNTGLFLMMFLVINQGLNFLWGTPSLNSWWMLVGIAGHAFVSTALLAASFIYFRDINTWLKVVFEQLQKQSTQPQRR
jgi:hypothetical protein